MKMLLPGARRHWQEGVQALRAGQWQAAAEAFADGLRETPDDALMWLNLARARLSAGTLGPAADAARRARDLQPDNPLCVRMLAECLSQQSRREEAAQAFDAYPPGAARDADFLNAQGNALFQARRLHEAVEVFFQALALQMDNALVHYRLGLTLRDLALNREATECFRTAIALDQGAVRLLSLSLLVHESRQSCDWRTLEQDTAALLAALDAADDATGQMLSPFALLAVDATPEQQHRMGAIRARSLTQGVVPLPPAGPRRPGRIRVGYLSSDFHHHATAVLMAELLERRDRERFEVFLYCHSLDDGTPLMHRIRAACDHHVDVRHLSNRDVALRLRADAIDIAVDLKGHTRGSRFELLAWRPAPVQVAYLGYPATTGADFIDYLIGDPVVTPLTHAGQYSEHIAQLPHSYQPNDRQRPLPPCPSRTDLGLPEDAVVLCCFNQTYKISPRMLDLWAAILHGAPKAVLWMLSWNAHAQARLTEALADRGVDTGRIFWAPKRPLDEHIARLRAADLFLDTWPCNAHTTASEALWAAVPVLTVPGPTFASRVAASLVTACGLPDLACASEDDYVALGAALANDPALLAHLKQQLEDHRLELPLFDTDRYARDYEALLLRMFERQQAGLAPTALPALPAAPDAPAEAPVPAPAQTETATADGAPPLQTQVLACQRQGRSEEALALLAGRLDPDTPADAVLDALHFQLLEATGRHAAARTVWQRQADTLAPAPGPATAAQTQLRQRGLRLLASQLEEAEQTAQTLLATDPMGAALETAELARVDPPAWQRLRHHWLTPGRIDLEHPAPAHFPLLLALQALDLGCAAHSHGLLTMIDELDVWHLGRLVRHPLLPGNGALLRRLGQAVSAAGEDLPLSPRGLFNLLALGWATFEDAEFDHWLRLLRHHTTREDTVRADPEGALQALHVISRQFVLPEERPALPGLEVLRTERPRLRIALCISGQLRGFRQAAPTWQRHLGLDGHDVTVIVHTWDEIGGRLPDPEIPFSVARVFGDTRFAQAYLQQGLRHGLAALQQSYPHFFAALRAEGHVEPADLQAVYGPDVVWAIEDGQAPALAALNNPERMHYKIEAAQALALEVAERDGAFDLMIRLRPDKLLQDSPIPVDWHQVLHDSASQRKVFTEDGVDLRAGLLIGDQFAAGTPEVMNAYAGAWSLTALAREQGWHQFPPQLLGHTSLAFTCLFNGLRVQRIPGLSFGRLVEPTQPDPATLRGWLAADLPRGPQTELDQALWQALAADTAP